MYRIQFAYNALTGRPDVELFPNAKSADDSTNYKFEPGHPVGLGTVSTMTTSSMPVAFVLRPEDMVGANGYAYDASTGSPAGILGFAAEGAITNSSGVANTRVTFSGKSAMAEPIFNAPTVGYTLPIETTNNYTKIKVWLATDNNVFWGHLHPTAGVTAATSAVIGVTAGLTRVTTGIISVNTAETVKALVIVGWDPSNTGMVLFKVLPAYQQLKTGLLYTS